MATYNEGAIAAFVTLAAFGLGAWLGHNTAEDGEMRTGYQLAMNSDLNFSTSPQMSCLHWLEKKDWQLPGVPTSGPTFAMYVQLCGGPQLPAR